MPNPVPYQEFAAAVRRAHPTLKTAAPDIWDRDDLITHAFVGAYPELKEHTIDPLEGTEGLTLPPLGVEVRTGPVPPPSLFEPKGPPQADPTTRTNMPMVARDTPTIPSSPEGFRKAKEGTEILLSRDASAVQRAGGASDIIRGTMEAVGTPLVVAGMATHPLATAVGVGTGVLATEGAEHVANAAGAPPDVSRLIGDLTGLIAGARAVGKQGFIEAGRDIGRRRNIAAASREQGAPPQEMVGLENQAASWDAEREHILNQAFMREDLRAETAILDRDQAASDKIVQAIRTSEMLAALADELKSKGSDPFNFLTAAAEGQKLLAAGETPPPPLLLNPATGPEIRPTNPNVILAGPAGGELPPTIEPVGQMAPRMATSGPPADPLLTQLGDQLESGLSQPPPKLDIPRQAKQRFRDREDYRNARAKVMTDLVDEMEYMTYQPGKLVRDSLDTSDSHYVPPTGGSEIYWDVIGRDSSPSSRPVRKMITAVLDLYRKVDGRSGLGGLPPEPVAEIAQKYDVGERALQNAYQRYAGDIGRVLERRTKQRIAFDKQRAARQTEAPPEPPMDAPPGALIDQDEMPADWLDLPPEGEGVPGEPGQNPTEPSLVSRFLHEEEGSLVIDPRIIDSAEGMGRWLRKHADEYGDQPWFEEASRALEEGDTRSAWRIAAVASARSLGASAVKPGEREKGAPPKAAPDVQTLIDQTKAAQRKQVETELGSKLPENVEVSPEGIITFSQQGGVGVPYLKVSATDRVLANTLNADLLHRADPTQIIRIEGNTDKALQITSQIADQVVREYPDSTISDMADLMGFDHLTPAEQRVEVGRAFRRAYSNAGKKLGEAGNWTQGNEDLFYHLSKVDETGAATEMGSVGALQAEGVKTPEGFVQWLGGKNVTPESLKTQGFELPKGIEFKKPNGELTPQAKVYARNWWRRQTRLAETQATIDALAKEGSALDKALVRSNIAAESRLTGGTLSQINGLSKAFLIAKLSTTWRNLRNQGMRYGFTMLDDLIAGTFAAVSGDKAAAKHHLGLVQQSFRLSPRGAASTVNLITKPWVDGLHAIYNYSADSIAGMKPKDVRRFLRVIEDFPAWEAKFLGSLSLEGRDAGSGGSKFKWINKITSPEVRNTVTVFNRMQEHFWRATVGDAVFRQQLVEAGMDPNTALKSPEKLLDILGEDKLDTMIGTAVTASLDATFAGDPIPGTAPALLLDVLSKHPVLSPILQLGFPFPRFNIASAPRWLWDHFPLAPLVDLTLHKAGALREDATNFGRGRYYFMRQLQRSAGDAETLYIEQQKEAYRASKALGDFIAAKDEARAAAAVYEKLEKRMDKGNALPELEQGFTEARDRLISLMEDVKKAKAEWRAAETRIKNLAEQRRKLKKTTMELQEAGVAKSPYEYFARKTTGAALLTAAYLLRSSDGAKGTKWYEYTVKDHPDPDDPTKTTSTVIDLRGEAPFVQPLFLADIMQDVYENTDWSGFTAEVLKGESSISEYLQSHYTGKYTSVEVFKDAAEAFFSVSPAAGSTRDIMQSITGRTAQGEPLDLDMFQRALLSTVGEWVGRFSSPLDMVSDVAAGLGDEESGKARIPATGGKEKKSRIRSFVDPTLANIPGANRAIEEKISPFTGEPIQSVEPWTRQTMGVTLRHQTPVEEELKLTGFPIGRAVPRQTGDRELDNEVNRAYAGLLQKTFSRLLTNERYTSLTPELKRDVLEGLFRQLKEAAYGTVARSLPREEAGEMLQSQGARDKTARWKRYLDGLVGEVASPAEPATEPVDAPEPGAPPAPPAFP